MPLALQFTYTKFTISHLFKRKICGINKRNYFKSVTRYAQFVNSFMFDTSLFENHTLENKFIKKKQFDLST